MQTQSSPPSHPPTHRRECLSHLKRPHSVHVRGNDRDALIALLRVAEDKLSVQVHLQGGRASRAQLHTPAAITSDLLLSVLRLGRTSTSLKSNLMSESTRGISTV